jgi:hypothetical protein
VEDAHQLASTVSAALGDHPEGHDIESRLIILSPRASTSPQVQFKVTSMGLRYRSQTENRLLLF